MIAALENEGTAVGAGNSQPDPQLVERIAKDFVRGEVEALARAGRNMPSIYFALVKATVIVDSDESALIVMQMYTRWMVREGNLL